MELKPIHEMSVQEIDSEINRRIALLSDSEKETIIDLLLKCATEPK